MDSKDKKLRVGIVFFGLPRCTKITLPTIEKYILCGLPVGCELFICASFSYQTKVTNKRSCEDGDVLASNYDYFLQYPHIFTAPEHLLDMALYEQLCTYGDKTWHDEGMSLRNLMLQLNSLRLGYLACKKNECDFYIFVRPDLFIHDLIPIADFIKKMRGQSNAVMVPSWQWHRGINDRFCVAGRQAADVFALRYERMLNYCQVSGREMHSERFLAHELRAHNVTIKTCSARMSRIRINGGIVQEEFSPLHRMGGSGIAFRAQCAQLYYRHKVLGIVRLIGARIRKLFR